MVVGARGIPDVEGGAEKNAEMIFPLIASRGYRVILVGLEGLVQRETYRGVELHPAPNRRLLKTDKLFYYLHAVKLARRLRPDIVHMQGLGASLFLLAYKAMGARTVVRYGSADYTLSKWGVIGKAGFFAAEMQARAADAVISVAPSLSRRLAKHGISKNVRLIGNAIDVPAAGESTHQSGTVPQMAKGPFILFVGRVTMQKNVHGLLEGFRLYQQRTGNTRHRLLLAGGLEDEEYVRSLQPLLGDNVDLLGRCNRGQLEELYGSCDLFINSSVHEGASNAVLEAISRNCPTVLSGIAENRDFGLPERAYFNQDDPAEIAGAMERALADPDAYRVDRSKFMTWPLVAEKTLKVYEEIRR
ncbi:glycosyltransferase family 4 protein [Croceibacterium sp. TMG7-5b_MA50]|uniref:glycosyltransferase family 4 protein n=1 Tax=Croceibacterium sp. TMG7-5b_MA50 TaxID=3121290 RepID=UPI00322189C5